ncbi:MAG TPA: lipopolysaccharide kinase InaA family protein [Candidatus Polarisedimenticolia bacterium]|nr:lipopolysaccharide kinase InaA family protein [Candidatus Polarisedimenticolia bacterium]
MEIPIGFVESEAHGFHVITRPVYYATAMALAEGDPERILASGTPPSTGSLGPHCTAVLRRPPGPMQGRGPTLEIAFDNGETLIVKKQRRGGLYGKVMGDVFKQDWQAVVEVSLSETAWKKGVPVAQVAFAMSAPAGEGRLAGYRRAYVGSVKLPGARSLMESLANESNETERRRSLVTAAAAINRAHGRGFTHGDLNLGNILIQRSGQGEYSGWLIDLSHSWLGGALRFDKRVENLMRLYRSAEKWLPATIPSSRFRDVVRFLRAYTEHRPGEVRRYIEAAAAYRSSFFLHRLSWKLRGVKPRPTASTGS